MSGEVIVLIRISKFGRIFYFFHFSFLFLLFFPTSVKILQLLLFLSNEINDRCLMLDIKVQFVNAKNFFSQQSTFLLGWFVSIFLIFSLANLKVKRGQRIKTKQFLTSEVSGILTRILTEHSEVDVLEDRVANAIACFTNINTGLVLRYVCHRIRRAN